MCLSPPPFRACRVFAHGASVEARVTPMEIDELSAGRRRRARRVLEPELQGRPRRHRPRTPHHAAHAAQRRHRPGRRRRVLDRFAIHAGHARHRQRHGPGRGARRRVCGIRAGARRLADAAARRAHAAQRDGVWHRRLHRRALRPPDGGQRPAARRWARSSSPAPPAAWDRLQCGCWRRAAIR